MNEQARSLLAEQKTLTEMMISEEIDFLGGVKRLTMIAEELRRMEVQMNGTHKQPPMIPVSVRETK